MRIKKFDCKIIKHRGTYEIVAKSKIKRLLGIQPIYAFGNEKYQNYLISPEGGWDTLSEAKKRLKIINKSTHIEI